MADKKKSRKKREPVDETKIVKKDKIDKAEKERRNEARSKSMGSAGTGFSARSGSTEKGALGHQPKSTGSQRGG